MRRRKKEKEGEEEEEEGKKIEIPKRDPEGGKESCFVYISGARCGGVPEGVCPPEEEERKKEEKREVEERKEKVEEKKAVSGGKGGGEGDEFTGGVKIQTYTNLLSPGSRLLCVELRFRGFVVVRTEGEEKRGRGKGRTPEQ